MGRINLEVTEAFLQSDYLPEFSLFSGRRDGLRLERLEIGVQPRPGVFGWLALGSTLSLRLPMAAGEWRRWKLWRTVWFMVGGPLLAVLFFACCSGCCMIYGRGPWQPLLLCLAVAAVESAVMLWLHFSVLWKLPRFYHRRQDDLDVLISLPESQREVAIAYQAAFASWIQAGQPKPEGKEQDEGWEDEASAGWDQGGTDKRGD